MAETRFKAGTPVLIVEDSPTQAARLQYYLEKHGFKVTVTRDGREALAALAESRPVMVVSDIVMPNMDGYELCRAVKQDAETADIPVILLTALTEPADVINGLACGANDFLAKPYTEKALLARVDRVFTNTELREKTAGEDGLPVWFAGKRYTLKSDMTHSVDFMLSTFEDAVEKNVQLNEANSSLKDALKKIGDLETRYRSLMDSSPAAVLVVGTDGCIWYVNQAAEVLFRRDAGELKGSQFQVDLNVEELPNEIALKLPDDVEATAELAVVETTWGDSDAYLVSLWDVTENTRLRQQLHDLSVTDELTGLSNRRGFMILAEQQVKLARRGRAIALLFIDLNDFKEINDTLGHKVGDEALIEVAELLRGALRDSDIIARVGGDEFAVLLVDAEPSFLPVAVERLDTMLDRRNAKSTAPYKLAMSIGAVAYGANDARELDELLLAADGLMYTDKKRRKAERAKRAAEG